MGLKVIEGNFKKEPVAPVSEEMKADLLKLCDTLREKVESGDISDVIMVMLFTDGEFGTSGCFHGDSKTINSLAGGLGYFQNQLYNHLEIDYSSEDL